MSPMHPLELPEIIECIGHFLPLWNQEKHQGGATRIVFTPKTFIACLLVSKLWHRTLSPLLWTNYDAEGMEHIPRGVLKNYGTHFRTFCVRRGWILFPFMDCTKLVQLTLNSNITDIGESLELVRSNPGLKSLKLGKVLRPLAGSIKELEIGWLTGLRVQGEDSDNGGNSDDQEDGSLIFPCLELVRLTGLILGPDPAEFVKCCPNLVRLELTMEKYMANYKDDKDIARITDSLRAHCPKLRSLAVNGTIDHGLKAALIRNCAVSNLSEIVVVVPSIDNRIADSIAFHASTLETLGILIMTDGVVNLDRLFQLPVRCPRLKQVSVGAWYCCETGPAILDAIRTAAWRGINKLEVLDLDIGDINGTSKRVDASTLQEMFEDGPIMGWHYHARGSTALYRDEVRMSRAFVEDMFTSVAGLENLRMLRWCMVVFTRSSRPTEVRFARLPFIRD
ncbi:hypothetical protein BGX30_003629 [Mortierella sp. GBA39]|nr:hypothetical protein BGX30_003629 [Mortierella sp. GBA39]